MHLVSMDEQGVVAAIATLGQHGEKEARETAIQTILTYARNILQHPGDDKYRRIKLTNAALNDRVLIVPAAKDVMTLWGWTKPASGEYMQLPHSVTAHDTRVVVSKLEDLHLNEEQRRHKLAVEQDRQKHEERARADREERERIKKQLELDRQEVAKEVHQDSVCAHAVSSRFRDTPIREVKMGPYEKGRAKK